MVEWSGEESSVLQAIWINLNPLHVEKFRVHTAGVSGQAVATRSPDTYVVKQALDICEWSVLPVA